MFQNVYVRSTGAFLPGKPITNDEMDPYILPINSYSKRLKRRILAENGIQTRHYALNEDGQTLHSASEMAGRAIERALAAADLTLADIDYLAAGSVGGDLAVPGFANQIQGYLHAPPMQTLSVQGICASGVAAMQAAARAIELRESTHAAVVACEFPSRLFRHSRFQGIQHELDFESHFLRWMLSDGAGACILSNQPAHKGKSLKLKWIHNKSFSGDYPTCMQIGSAASNPNVSYLDYGSMTDVDQAGAFLLRQDIRLLPNLFDLGISEYANLVKQGIIDPKSIAHFLCHYSSQKFSGIIKTLLSSAGLEIPENKWFSNLTTVGNTGSASIFIMLHDFLEKVDIRAGQNILCFVPESGRFTVCFFMLEVVENTDRSYEVSSQLSQTKNTPHIETSDVAHTLRELQSIWHSYRSRVFRSRLVTDIYNGQFSNLDYLKWMENWIPQVREGSLWMREAIQSLPEMYSDVKALIQRHANEEQFDYEVLYRDYIELGGTKLLADLKRNPGGEALNAYMYAQARCEHSYALLGGIFIIEGTGQKIIPTLLPLIRKLLHHKLNAFRFLEYHGENDLAHMERWLSAVKTVHTLTASAKDEIIYSAQSVANLYAMQWELVS